uniref:Lipocalin/cytosolic fatty-acid binding domain-containing protein n=1 Tax=Otus sunia TaxID=257818 RepID=A0A8C8E5Z3_9STRI
MTAVLPSLALALLSLLRAGAEVPVQPGFNTEKFAGTWHVTAAASNCSVFLKMKDEMKSSITTISFTPEGDMAMKLVWWVGHSSQGAGALLLPTQGSCVVPVVHPPTSMALPLPFPGVPLLPRGPPTLTSPHFGCLAAAREQDVSPQLLQKFEELIPTMGLTKDMLAILPKSGECQEGTGWHTQPLCMGTLHRGSEHCL